MQNKLLNWLVGVGQDSTPSHGTERREPLRLKEGEWAMDLSDQQPRNYWMFRCETFRLKSHSSSN